LRKKSIAAAGDICESIRCGNSGVRFGIEISSVKAERSEREEGLRS